MKLSQCRGFPVTMGKWRNLNLWISEVVRLDVCSADRNKDQSGLSPLAWLSYFWLTKLKTHYVAPQFFIFQQTIQIALNFFHWNAHIFLFWLNPTGHSKFHNTSNHPTPATDSGRTARTPLYQPVQAVPPFFSPFMDRGTGEDQYLCPWQACAITAWSACAR